MALPKFVSIENLTLLAELNLGLLFMQVLLFVSSVFLMLLILVQRGKGGGLTGALGGMGGQSAFGSKAGDAFTKITVITAMIWITLCMVTIAGFNPPPRSRQAANNDATLSATIDPVEETVPASNDSTDQADGDAPSDGGSGEGDSGQADAAVPESSETDGADPAGNVNNPGGDGN